MQFIVQTNTWLTFYGRLHISFQVAYRFQAFKRKKTDALRNLIHCERHFFSILRIFFFQPKIFNSFFFWLLIWKWIELKSEIYGINMSFGRNISEEKSKWKNLNKIAFLIWIMVADTKKMGRGICMYGSHASVCQSHNFFVGFFSKKIFSKTGFK